MHPTPPAVATELICLFVSFLRIVLAYVDWMGKDWTGAGRGWAGLGLVLGMGEVRVTWACGIESHVLHTDVGTSLSTHVS